ncbi:MAG: NgoFVII family restriction endonuclease [Candidatus Saelkia tenebricola]|nr:NgoFVII family restriction endonuclease [Candidatus Saelkia tenebricola]
MIFLDNQPKEQLKEYKALLSMVGSLSNLFSDSAIPYLYYRVAENAFCRAFKAENLSRSDCSADAKKDSFGLGLKTFLEGNSKSWQKVAEFNKARSRYECLRKDPAKMIYEIAKMRNKRITSTKAMHSIERMGYHCVARRKGKFILFEEEMLSVNLDKIRFINKSRSKNIFYFSDTNDEYKFDLTKSTLYKRFVTASANQSFKVNIIRDPFVSLKNFYKLTGFDLQRKPVSGQIVCLPLYSAREKKVMPRSGLNQWNASGRARDYREVYIPVPLWIYDCFPGFFPDKTVKFDLVLPKGKTIKAKMCQPGTKGRKDRCKALMSSEANKELGSWLLDDVLGVPEGELVTMQHLEEVGIDSVEVEKMSAKKYCIRFKETGTYEDFEENYKK